MQTHNSNGQFSFNEYRNSIGIGRDPKLNIFFVLEVTTGLD
jgi:hypothetical protein